MHYTTTNLQRTAVKSPLLQFTANTATPSGSNKRNLVVAPPKTSMVPAYYITMHFTSPMKHYNHTAANMVQHGIKTKGNFTLPACSTYNGNAYVSCNHCNVSSYTAMNVTYGCYDINNLCPSYVTKSSSTAGASTKRQLLEGDTSSHDIFVQFDEEFENEDEDLSSVPRFVNAVTEEFEDSMSDFEQEALGEYHDQVEDELDHYQMHHHRFLQQVKTDDGNTTTDDGGGTTDDGVLSDKAQGSISEYGALLEALAAELASTLSINPFDINLDQATPILGLCGSLAGCILFGSLFLMKWDAGDLPLSLDIPYDYSVVLTYCSITHLPLISPLTRTIMFVAERSEALKEKHEEAEMIKAIILGDKAAIHKAIVTKGGNDVTDGIMIKEKPPPAMLNSGHTQSFFGDITRSLRNSYSTGTLYSHGVSAKSKVFVGSPPIVKEGGNEDDELEVQPGNRISSKPQNNDKTMSGKSMNGNKNTSSKLNVSGKSVMATAVYQEIDDISARVLASHFADAVLHDEALSFADHFDGEHHVNLYDSFSWRTLMILLENHYMTHFWIGGASLAKSRCLRYMVRIFKPLYHHFSPQSFRIKYFHSPIKISPQTICPSLPGDLSLYHDQCLCLHIVFLGIVSTSHGMQYLSDQGINNLFFIHPK